MEFSFKGTSEDVVKVIQAFQTIEVSYEPNIEELSKQIRINELKDKALKGHVQND